MIPHKNPFDREEEPAGQPARGIHAEKRVEGEAVDTHASTHEQGSDPVTPAGIGAALTSHGHLQHNRTADRDPTADDDVDAGYSSASIWINISTPAIFVCVTAAAGAADWNRIDLKEHAIAISKAGVVAAAADTADFIQVAALDMKLTRLKATCLTKPSSDATIQIRRSTDSGATFSDAFGTVAVTSAGAAKIFVSDPADLDIDEGDGFNFSVTGGADGEDYMIQIIGEMR